MEAHSALCVPSIRNSEHWMVRRACTRPVAQCPLLSFSNCPQSMARVLGQLFLAKNNQTHIYPRSLSST
eukprot:1139496-Pelagomonas_calceolata.AAC.5